MRYDFCTVGKLLIGIFLSTILSSTQALSQEDNSLHWNSLRSGEHFALLRHALAPGTGDPPGFKLDSCQTQRNLSLEGRKQAAKIGDLFREHGIDKARVFSSQWCRCLDTAQLLDLGPVESLPFLNSFYNNFEYRESQTQKLSDWLKAQTFDQPLVLVTHQVNITALTSVYPSSGELVIIHRTNHGEFEVVGTIQTK
ncbi:MAG: histidine phosphatase family protein [Deltaproteobacteria bacterium]|jgi:phosphohistidine phosphatase SixA|nr:histidine phosphatase family protein [Deltaproteobacteria bacterium]MBW2519205.1 histidine phosphatase family protein [Deltaproteobacteria bacterium]